MMDRQSRDGGLTKEQLEELHEEFARFLATQSITADEWDQVVEVLQTRNLVPFIDSET